MIGEEKKHYDEISLAEGDYASALKYLQSNKYLNEFQNDDDNVIGFACGNSGLLFSLSENNLTLPIINENNEKFLEGSKIISAKNKLLKILKKDLLN